MNLLQVLESLRTDPETAAGVVHWETIPARPDDKLHNSTLTPPPGCI